MDHYPHFRREIKAFEAAARRAVAAGEAPSVPSCPGWTMSDLVVHLGGVHRVVGCVVKERLPELPDVTDAGLFDLPAEREDWPVPGQGPTPGPVPVALVDWFAAGARALDELFVRTDPNEAVWTWSADHTVGFWLRVQTIEASVHRWDAERALGAAGPIDTEVAVDAVGHAFEVMAPYRRSVQSAPLGAGERFRFRRTDGPGVWTACFEGDEVRLAGPDGPCDVEAAGTASDLMLFLWGRRPAQPLTVTGDHAVLDRYSTLVPPV
ncbi:maleylpyruvate isomerase family mycothiol-dependent enzyme [Embleya sp. NBC_00896]|uniref:maleylpyruvate isomerase family mycothiol-dependent enzyme n=1 Tax=Embleya sp. NBC_00896 TaxID=2975961 RepID=UPI002F90CD1D|nr:maleylpyruvate isomerase family mycothiol-dependent enzyme [Embleya sp. NBC_00896]